MLGTACRFEQRRDGMKHPAAEVAEGANYALMLWSKWQKLTEGRDMKDLPQRIIMLSGVVLIVFGITAIGFQMIADWRMPANAEQQQSLTANSSQFQVTTHYVGIELVVIGAVLEIVGYLGLGPWRKSDGPN
jgi:hypothetical protein